MSRLLLPYLPKKLVAKIDFNYFLATIYLMCTEDMAIHRVNKNGKQHLIKDVHVATYCFTVIATAIPMILFRQASYLTFEHGVQAELLLVCGVFIYYFAVARAAKPTD